VPVCGRIIQQTSDDDVCDVTEAEKEAADEDAEKKQVAKSGPFTVDESCALVAWFQSTTHGAGWKENCTNKADKKVLQEACDHPRAACPPKSPRSQRLNCYNANQLRSSRLARAGGASVKARENIRRERLNLSEIAQK